MRIEKNKLLNICSSLQFSSLADSALWHLDKSGRHTVHSTYRFLNSGEGVTFPLTRSVWALKIPLKIKHFL
jgi:hypothetical protein